MVQIEFLLPRDVPAASLNFFSEIFETVSIFETEDQKNWLVRIIYEKTPPADIKDQIYLLTEELGYAPDQFLIQKIEDKDWLAENRKSFPALTIGRFYIFGSHLQPAVDPNLIALQLDASLAFGTGKHATTQMCLEFIEEIKSPTPTDSILDLGCGTAILAMAMAKLWNIPVVASDIDADSVKLAQENCSTNRVDDLVKVVESEGFMNSYLQEKAPYDLIVANILAEPLKQLAPEMKKYSSPSARLILSGLLIEQVDAVLGVYERNGFQLEETKRMQEWAALKLKSI